MRFGHGCSVYRKITNPTVRTRYASGFYASHGLGLGMGHSRRTSRTDGPRAPPPRGRPQALPIGGIVPGDDDPACYTEPRRNDGSERAVIHDISPGGEYDISPSGSS